MCTLIQHLGFMGTFFLNYLVGCLSMIVWTPAVLGVLYAGVCICTCSAQLSLFHLERRSRNTLIISLVFQDFGSHIAEWNGSLLIDP